MASFDEKDLTVAMGPGELPDPDATIFDASAMPSAPGVPAASAVPSVPAVPDVPVPPAVSDAIAPAPPASDAATPVAARLSSLPSLDLDDVPAAPASVPSPAAPGAEDPTRVSPDGIDALDDPYFSPAVMGEELTTAQPVVSIPSPVESLPERKRRLPWWAVMLLVIALLGAAGGAAYVTYEQELWGGKTIPEVVGMTEDDARAALEELGFVVEVEYRAGDGSFGTVLDCSPREGRRVDPAEGVTLTVAGERVVPQVVGLTVDEATQALYDAGATDVALTYRNSSEEAGTVLAVDPAEGSPFVSTDKITLTVAQGFTVPNVEGMTEAEALEALEAAGLAGSVTYVQSSEERGTVVSSNPGVGAQVEEGATVELSVSSPYPSSALSLIEYFDVTPQDLSAYLASEGFSVRYGSTYPASGNARAVYASSAGDVLQITNDPEVGGQSGSSSGDVLASGAAVGGVRLAFSSASLPEGAARETEEGVSAVMEACGFKGLVDSCTQDDAALPKELLESEDYEEAHFICAYGYQDGYTWVVRIGGVGDATGVVALVAPTSHFSALDLSAYGESVCDYVVHADLF